MVTSGNKEVADSYDTYMEWVIDRCASFKSFLS